MFRVFNFLVLFSVLPMLQLLGADIVEVRDFGDNPGNLKMYMHVSSTITDTSAKLPLIVALHGCSQNADGLANQSGWNKLADKYQFIVIYPQQKIFNNPSLCFNWFNVHDSDYGKGESASINSMIEYCTGNFNIDTTQIFAYGLSAGAMMSVNLLVNYSCRFKGGAIFAGGPYGAARNAFDALKVIASPKDKTPAEWGALIKQDSLKNCLSRLVVMHGTSDMVVDIRNSIELVDQWTNLHHIENNAPTVAVSFAGNPLVDRLSYTDGKGNEVISFYKILNTNHALPVDPGDGELQGGSTGVFAVDKDFFSTYYVAKDFGLIK